MLRKYIMYIMCDAAVVQQYYIYIVSTGKNLVL